MPWKHFEDVAAKEELCIVNWPDNVMAPGPGFDLKKLTPAELQLLVGAYIDAVQSGSDVNGTTFHIKKWSQGTS